MRVGFHPNTIEVRNTALLGCVRGDFMSWTIVVILIEGGAVDR